jgi:Domain of unknown function (DUF4262)
MYAPAFSYTLGLTAPGHQGPIMVGLAFEVAQELNLAAGIVRHGRRFHPGEMTGDLAESVPIAVITAIRMTLTAPPCWSRRNEG